MTYRDDHEAALARLVALEAELARVRAENAHLRNLVTQLEVDATLGRDVRRRNEEEAYQRARELGGLEEAAREARLRVKMEREQREVEAAIEAAERLAELKKGE